VAPHSILTAASGRLLKLMSRWRAEAEKKGHRTTRIGVAFEAGHDGFWLAHSWALGPELLTAIHKTLG
jgi:transposase